MKTLILAGILAAVILQTGCETEVREHRRVYSNRGGYYENDRRPYYDNGPRYYDNGPRYNDGPRYQPTVVHVGIN